MSNLRKINFNEFCRKTQAAFCLLSLIKMSVFSLLFFSVQAQTGMAQVRPNPQQIQEELLIRLLTNTKRAKTITEIPAPFVEAVKREYEASPSIQKETKFETFLASRYFWIREQLELRNGYQLPAVRSNNSMCADGSCDAPLNSSIWNGAWTGGNSGNISDANLPIATWTNGLLPNTATVNIAAGSPIVHSSQEHHVFVPNGNDPTVGTLLKTVAPNPATGNLGSLRIGNTVNQFGGERVSKTFVVPANTTANPDAATLTFWYASVFQNPGHQLSDQPGFGVYVFDSNSNKINNLVDIDNSTSGNQEFIVADGNNPFFGKISGGSVLYKGWTCVTIDLSKYAGQTVTILFVNRDCTQGGHWGYSYIDSLCFGCGGNPTGNATFNQAKSDCAKGEICFDYTVPKTVSGTTGKVNLNLELYQNGSLVNTLTSGDLTSDGTFCFKNFSSSLNSSIGGFDWKATASFTIAGATISPKEIGKRGDGFVEGKNNDCSISPPIKEIDACCPPISPEIASKQFVYAGKGNITEPYTIKFQPSQSFKNSIQSYLDYIHFSVDNTIEKASIIWGLHDCGTTGNPIPCVWDPNNLPIAIESHGTWWEYPWLNTNHGDYKTWGWNTFFGNTADTIVQTPVDYDDRYPMKVGNKYRIGGWFHFPANERKGTPVKVVKGPCPIPDFYMQIIVGGTAMRAEPTLVISDSKGKIIDRIPVRPIKK